MFGLAGALVVLKVELVLLSLACKDNVAAKPERAKKRPMTAAKALIVLNA